MHTNFDDPLGIALFFLYGMLGMFGLLIISAALVRIGVAIHTLFRAVARSRRRRAFLRSIRRNVK